MDMYEIAQKENVRLQNKVRLAQPWVSSCLTTQLKAGSSHALVHTTQKDGCRCHGWSARVQSRRLGCRAYRAELGCGEQ